jgi:hypothetical protein
MTLADIAFVAEGIIAVVAVVGLIASYFRTSYSASTIQLQQENIKALLDQGERHKTELASNRIRLEDLEREVTFLKTLPLAEIATDLKGIMQTQNKILDVQNTLLERLAK